MKVTVTAANAGVSLEELATLLYLSRPVRSPDG